MTRAADRTTMQERILETADRLFYGQGIRAVGVDTIAAEIGISKRTLYNYFPSKDELIVAYLSRRLQPALPSSLPPVQQILGNFERLERTFTSGVFRGCPFVNAVAELKEPAHAANKIALAFKEQRRIWFRDLLIRLDVDAGRARRRAGARRSQGRRHRAQGRVCLAGRCGRQASRRFEARPAAPRQTRAVSYAGLGRSTRCRSSTGGSRPSCDSRV